MSIENEVKKLREAIEANTAALVSTGLGVAPEQPAALQPAAVPPAALQPAAVPPAALQPAALQPAAVPPAALQPAALQPAAVPPAAVAGPSADQVNQSLVAEAARIGSTGPAQIVALLGKYGGSKISLIDPRHYPAILAEIAIIPVGV